MAKCSRCGAPLVRSACPSCRGQATTRRWGAPPSSDQDPPGSSGLVPARIWGGTIGQRQGAATGRVQPRHFLVPPFGEWIRIERTGAPLVLGRDEQCGLRIESPTVSRRHCQLEFKGTPPRLVVRDLGTTNGTRVNGKLVEGEQALADRDVLRIGDVTAVYRTIAPGAREGEPAKPRPEVLNATIPLDVAGRKVPDGLTGDIALFPMEDLIGRFTILRATGTLFVEVDGVAGEASFAAGAVKAASFAGREGAAAVLAISELRRGRFLFKAGSPARR